MTGHDVHSFLNNQLISDINKMSAISYSAICNPKGRILYTLLLIPCENGFYVAVDQTLSNDFQQYITMRIFRMDVQIETSSLQLVNQINAAETLQSFELYPLGEFNPTSGDKFWQLMFSLGLPWVTSLTTEKFIPQHLNLDQKNIIAFEKGCYPGQEIIARLHYLGQIKKRMQLIDTKESLDVQAGDKTMMVDLKQTVELCSPCIRTDTGWQVQAITNV